MTRKSYYSDENKKSTTNSGTSSYLGLMKSEDPIRQLNSLAESNADPNPSSGPAASQA
jgi:hypothetical protein